MYSEYGDLHRQFIQFALSRKCVSVEEALKFCNKNHPDEVESVDDLKSLMAVINSRVNKHDLYLKIAKNEIDGDERVVLVSTFVNSENILPSGFDKHEVEFFYRVANEILEAGTQQQISGIAFLNLTNGMHVSKDKAELLLKKWTKDGYLTLNKDQVSFGIRFILEFAPCFENQWKEYVHRCNLCKEVVFHGKVCSSCEEKLHSHCLQIYLQRQAKCPVCKNDWNDD